MKICPKCNRTYAEEFSFCNTCGCNLEMPKKSNKNTTIAIVIVAIVAVLGIGITVSEQKKMKETRQEIEDYKYNKALQEYRSIPTTSDLRVNSDWTTEKSRNYIYIKGSVTNISSSKTISYFKIEAKFYDQYGKVIDSDWTNDGDDLGPGETRQFEIMHKYNNDEVDIKLSVAEVN